MATFQDFIKDRNVSYKATYAGPSEDDTMFEWVVMIELGGKRMKADYRMGLAHCKFVPSFAYRTDSQELRRIKQRSRTVSQLSRYGPVTPNKPELHDVLWSLQMDCSAVAYCTDKWDFIDEFGYEDGREGERIYRACKQQLKKVKAFMGGLFDEFMELEEE